MRWGLEEDEKFWGLETGSVFGSFSHFLKTKSLHTGCNSMEEKFIVDKEGYSPQVGVMER